MSQHDSHDGEMVMRSARARPNHASANNMAGFPLLLADDEADAAVQEPAEAAQTSIYLATSHEVAGVTGKFFMRSKERRSKPITHDREVAATLWAVSERLTASDRIAEVRPKAVGVGLNGDFAEARGGLLVRIRPAERLPVTNAMGVPCPSCAPGSSRVTSPSPFAFGGVRRFELEASMPVRDVDLQVDIEHLIPFYAISRSDVRRAGEPDGESRS